MPSNIVTAVFVKDREREIITLKPYCLRNEKWSNALCFTYRGQYYELKCFNLILKILCIFFADVSNFVSSKSKYPIKGNLLLKHIMPFKNNNTYLGHSYLLRSF